MLFFASTLTPSQAQYKILCLGNSITQGSITRDIEERPSYRYKLWQKLVDENIDFEFVGSHDVNEGGAPAVKGTVYKGKTYTNRNEGHWGWTVDEILNGKNGEGNLAQWLQTYTPDIVLIHLGTNDVFRQCPSDPDCFSKTKEELSQVIDLLRDKNPTITIFLAQVIPANLQPSIPEDLITLNSKIQELAIEYTTPTSSIILVDQHTSFDAVADTHDNVHPNASGEEKMAQKWFAAIQSYLAPLPVELMEFSGKINAQGLAELHWQTASETNNAYFEVQRARDVDSFQAIGKVQGAGTTNIAQAYSFVDSAAMPGSWYYRLKQVDTDGSSSYSKFIRLDVTQYKQALKVYPTSSSGLTHVNVHLQHHEADPQAEIHVYTSHGKLVHYEDALKSKYGSVHTRIPTHTLQGAGLYLVRVVTGNSIFQSMFILK
ncbi:GDSL-type esterase/lipase family protein [Pontibacter oryzae]|uniref:T9SS C-terminal target domain-containing protein n=1 Tax=Pontibacter oryzae TaxID=2304593 RepID=A0A399SJV3_9BACT|nr:GDSL-type esterase/lipase family protein [Pontibacter oryzae]RIJ43071.1 T9SS C-terminal target domain-containing protein [Pontibacter oryzae]